MLTKRHIIRTAINAEEVLSTEVHSTHENLSIAVHALADIKRQFQENGDRLVDRTRGFKVLSPPNECIYEVSFLII